MISYSLSGGPNNVIASDGQKIYLWSNQFDDGEGVYALNMDLSNPTKIASGSAVSIQVCDGTLYIGTGKYTISEVYVYDIATKKKKNTIALSSEGSLLLEGVIGNYLLVYEGSGLFAQNHLIELN